MTQAQHGDTVKVHYTGKLEDGTQFDTSTSGDPLEFTLGGGQIIPGFEKAILGMTPGDAKTVTIPSQEAYGDHREDMVVVVNKTQFPDHITPQVGQQLEMRQANNQPLNVVITDISGEEVTLDANHPLAGKDLVFDLELVEIV
ncbi:MAG: peptidylprolyl isomerase [Anaerolineae bacterium]|nr:peptidylprolyl isomerase [Anaerolineae bacterium]MCB0182373.1 peptidylprolyl isomerase [Anaerolineae bacterium]MCB0223069.1 peptidylprolyl isomerase [Anaerolineae bacterium]MCB9104018.1 peptidylprolyl isomerase [Anaerolineales bacterium]